MDKVKTFYNFEKIEERGQKKFKKNIAHNKYMYITQLQLNK